MSLLQRRPPAPSPEVLVIIGAHRDELAFGERVVAELDPKRFAALRILQGLRGDPPTPDQRASFRDRHHALYLQFLDHVAPHHRLLIDLHSGRDETGQCGDVLCAKHRLLDCVAARAVGLDGRVRCVSLVADTSAIEPPEPPYLIARPEIPEAVWNPSGLTYVGIEAYLRADGSGHRSEWQFAATLVELVADCAASMGARATGR